MFLPYGVLRRFGTLRHELRVVALVEEDRWSPFATAQPRPCAGSISFPSQVHSTAGSPSRGPPSSSFWLLRLRARLALAYCHELGLVAVVNGDDAMNLVAVDHGPASPFRRVHFVATVPGPLDAGLSVSGAVP